MWNTSKYFNYLCMGLVIFAQIISGCLQQVTLLPHLNRNHQDFNKFQLTTLHLCFLLNLIATVNGFVLLFGAILRQAKVVASHIVVNTVCSVVVIIYFIVTVVLKKLEPHLVIDSLIVTLAVYVFVSCLEYSVYLFYKNITSEKEEDRAELVINECA